MADLLSTCRSIADPSCKSSSVARRAKWTASRAASDAATISASQEDRATVGCFFEDHETAAQARDMLRVKLGQFSSGDAREAFGLVDRDGSGKLDRAEVRARLFALRA